MTRILTLLFIAVFSFSYAQEVTVASSQEYTNQFQNAYWTDALGQDNTGYYLLREFGPISNTTIVLEKYSPDFKLLYATNIESTSGTFNDSKLHRYTAMSNGRVYVFLVGWNKAKQQNSFHVKVVDEDGTVSDRMFDLEIESATGQMKSSNYKFSFSPDGSKLLVLTEKPFSKGLKETLRLQVFDTDLFSSTWKQDLTLENDSERYPINEIILDDKGTAFLLKDIKISNKEHVYQLITTGGDFSTITDINLQGYGLGQRKMQLDQAGNLIINATLVPAGRRNTDWQAIWFFKADEKGQVVQNKIEALGSEMLSLVVSSKNSEKEGYVLENYVLKDVLLKSDGGVMLLTEEQRQRKVAIGQSSPPVYEYTLFYGNALAISIDEEGNRIWNAVIEKNQEEKTLNSKVGFGSYAYQLKNDKLYVVWNYMNIYSDPPMHKFRYWIDDKGGRNNIDNIFGKEAFFPTLLTVISNDGSFDYRERTFKSFPLENLQKKNVFPMAVDPAIFFTREDGMIILSHMPGLEAKRYKFNVISF